MRFRAHRDWQTLLRSPRFNILKLSETRLPTASLFRSWIRIRDNHSGAEIGGMAEGFSLDMSRIRAAAEAYERLLLDDLRRSCPAFLRGDAPYGIGVANHLQDATRRAYAEFWERSLLDDPAWVSKLSLGKASTVKRNTPAGDVVICSLLHTTGLIGSGYGFTEDEALDSARRSIQRNLDFPQEKRTFNCGFQDPKELVLTPQEDPWLECVLVGVFNPGELPKFGRFR